MQAFLLKLKFVLKVKKQNKTKKQQQQKKTKTKQQKNVALGFCTFLFQSEKQTSGYILVIISIDHLTLQGAKVI